jgi:hypothetical protein
MPFWRSKGKLPIDYRKQKDSIFDTLSALTCRRFQFAVLAALKADNGCSTLPTQCLPFFRVIFNYPLSPEQGWDRKPHGHYISLTVALVYLQTIDSRFIEVTQFTQMSHIFSLISRAVAVSLKVKIGPVSKQSHTQSTPVAPEWIKTQLETLTYIMFSNFFFSFWTFSRTFSLCLCVFSAFTESNYHDNTRKRWNNGFASENINYQFEQPKTTIKAAAELMLRFFSGGRKMTVTELSRQQRGRKI